MTARSLTGNFANFGAYFTYKLRSLRSVLILNGIFALLSYPLMALVIALLLARFSALPKWLAFLPGLLVCYLLGTGWLALSTRCGFGHALAVGVLPFLLPDFFKVMLATVLVKGLATLTKQETKKRPVLFSPAPGWRWSAPPPLYRRSVWPLPWKLFPLWA